MTVRELIEELEKHPQDAIAVTEDPDFDIIDEIREVWLFDGKVIIN